MKTTLVDMTKRVSLFYGWGYECSLRGVWPVTAQAALFVDHRVAPNDWLKPVATAQNLYEVDAFWHGYHTGLNSNS